jgi:hypothetical protein
MAKDNKSHIHRVWEVIENAGIYMMVTRFGGGLRAHWCSAQGVFYGFPAKELATHIDDA